MVVIADGRHCRWSSLQMVVIADGRHCRWSSLQMVVIADGHCRVIATSAITTYAKVAHVET
jgi:hypothetical protein